MKLLIGLTRNPTHRLTSANRIIHYPTMEEEWVSAKHQQSTSLSTYTSMFSKKGIVSV
jgi:hypothetical protein